MDTGRNIRRLRRARDLTQEQLAQLASMHPQHVSAVERGLRPTAALLERLALALGVEPAQLLQPFSATGGEIQHVADDRKAAR